MILDSAEFHERDFYLGVYETEATAYWRCCVHDIWIHTGAQKDYLQMANGVIRAQWSSL